MCKFQPFTYDGHQLACIPNIVSFTVKRRHLTWKPDELYPRNWFCILEATNPNLDPHLLTRLDNLLQSVVYSPEANSTLNSDSPKIVLERLRTYRHKFLFVPIYSFQ